MSGTKAIAEFSGQPAAGGASTVSHRSRFDRLLALDGEAVKRRLGQVLPIVKDEIGALMGKDTRKDARRAKELAEKYLPYDESLMKLKLEAQEKSRWDITAAADFTKLALALGMVFAGLGGMLGAGIDLLVQCFTGSSEAAKAAIEHGYNIGALVGLAIYAAATGAIGIFTAIKSPKDESSACSTQSSG